MKDSFIKTWDKLVQESTLLGFKKDQTLFYQGHLPYGVFIIASGKVDFISEDNDGQKEVIGAPLNTPIGIDLHYDNYPYPFTAIARGPVVAFFIHKSSLNKILKPDSGKSSIHYDKSHILS